MEDVKIHFKFELKFTVKRNGSLKEFNLGLFKNYVVKLFFCIENFYISKPIKRMEDVSKRTFQQIYQCNWSSLH